MTDQEYMDQEYMRKCIALAKMAEAMDEVPVGAIVVARGEIVGLGFNLRETRKCATAHAEISAIQEACKTMGGWRLPDSTLYVTMEPCPMCAGAIINARIGRVVWGTDVIRFGAFGSLLNLAEYPVNHKPELCGGVLAEECRALLQDYFRAKRTKK